MIDGRRRRGGAADRRTSSGPTSSCSTGCCPRSPASRSAAGCAARPRRATLPIIMLTARGEESDRCAGSTSAPTTTSPSRSRPTELIARIRAVLRRARPLPPTRCCSFRRPRDGPRGPPRARAARDVHLGPTEFRLLRFLLSNRAGSSPASSCSTGSGATTSMSSRAPSTSTSAACARRSTAGEAADLIRTVRSAGYALDVNI